MSRWLPLALALAGLIFATQLHAAEPSVPLVDPSELTKHPDWNGKEVAVDGRVRYFKPPNLSELVLKRTEVTFRLPPNLRPERNGDIPVVRVQGVLKKVGGEWFCDVTALTPLPKDIDRLEQGIAALQPNDYEHRLAWARWAERRAEEFDDEPLKAQAKAIEADAIRIEADRAEGRPLERAAHWLKLAERARSRKIPEPEPSALSHRAFRTRLAEAKISAELDALAAEIEAFLPEASKANNQASLATWQASYAADPAETYRKAPTPVRATLDRRLLTDVLAKSFELKAAADPKGALALGDEAEKRLPDRPELTTQLRKQGTEAQAKDVTVLRQGEMEELAKRFEAQGDNQRADRVRRDWLDDQRAKLSSSDAEGRVALAKQYAGMVNDREMARLLCVDALNIDPRYRDAEDQLKRMGFRKFNDEWVEASQAQRREAATEEGNAGQGGGTLRGLTANEVIRKMGGKPDQVSRMASQGQVVEQWIFRGLKETQYINFVRRPNSTQPTVEAYYSLSTR